MTRKELELRSLSLVLIHSHRAFPSGTKSLGSWTTNFKISLWLALVIHTAMCAGWFSWETNAAPEAEILYKKQVRGTTLDINHSAFECDCCPALGSRDLHTSLKGASPLARVCPATPSVSPLIGHFLEGNGLQSQESSKSQLTQSQENVQPLQYLRSPPAITSFGKHATFETAKVPG